MRIGIITYDFYPFEGGQGRHIYEILKRFEGNSKFEFKVISPTKNELKNHVTLFHFTQQIGKNILFSILINICLKQLIKKYKLDIIHIHGGPGGLFLCRPLNIPVIYTVHHTYYQQYRLISGQKWKWIFSKIEPMGYKLANKVICVSNSTKNVLVNNYQIDRNKIEVIPNGVDTEFFYPMNDIQKIKNSVLYVGRLDERKGIDILVQSILHVIIEIPDIKLYIGGKGKLRKSLEEFVRYSNLQSNVQFLGFVPDEELPKLYNQVEVCVVPSVFEGFGITVVESMASKTPVIGSKVDGIVEIIRNKKNGILVAPKNSKELANAIIELMLNPELKQKLGENGLNDVNERFDWNKTVQNLAHVYILFEGSLIHKA